MNLMNCSVKHISWGIGTVTEQKDNYIKIIFGVGEKQFVYPDAFEKFLKCEDTNMQSQIEEELALKKQQEIQSRYEAAIYTYQTETLPQYQQQLDDLNAQYNQAETAYNQADTTYQMAFYVCF